MKAKTFTKEFASFVDDLGGFLWSVKAARSITWESLAKEINLAPATLFKLANRVTKNPQLYTCWKVLRGLDNAGVIRHSQLERYRGISKPKKRAA